VRRLPREHPSHSAISPNAGSSAQRKSKKLYTRNRPISLTLTATVRIINQQFNNKNFFLKQNVQPKTDRSKYTHELSVEKHACTAAHGGLERARARAEKAKRRRDKTAHTHDPRGRHTLHYNCDAIWRWSCEQRRPAAAERTARKRNEKATDAHTLAVECAHAHVNEYKI